MLIKVLDTNCKEWDDYIDKLPDKYIDVYYKREYYKLQEVNGEGKGKLFIYEEDKNIAIYPFLINEIKGYNLDRIYYDLETAYGYGGPVVHSMDEAFNMRFEKKFQDYCKENNIVAEFIRFNPMFDNHKIFKNDIDIIQNRTTIYVDLDKDLDQIWSEEISSKNRNMIRKAEKSGLEVVFDKDLDSFKYIYEETMKKVNANKYYYFNDNYYNELQNLNNIYISIKLNNDIIASAIFMQSKDYFHYHLSGSLKEYLKYSPNNLLLWKAIEYAKNNGFKLMHLGGGIKNSPDDNLFKFKKSFGKGKFEFYIGKRVHNKEIYQSLIEQWENKNGKNASLFLQYKL